MTWSERTGIVLILAVYAAGYLTAWWGRWDERVQNRRRRRLIERLGRERSPW
jgi:hypothetical protein